MGPNIPSEIAGELQYPFRVGFGDIEIAHGVKGRIARRAETFGQHRGGAAKLNPKEAANPALRDVQITRWTDGNADWDADVIGDDSNPAIGRELKNSATRQVVDVNPARRVER